MGLDWILNTRRPHKGYEEEFAILQQEARDTDSQKAADNIFQKMDKISDKAFDVIGCPMIGRDKEADNWIRQQMKEAQEHRDWPQNKDFIGTFEDVVKTHKGQYITDLAKEKGGLGAVLGMMCSRVDFRGKVVGYCEYIPEDLQERAYRDQTPEEMLEYANELESAINMQQALDHMPEEEREYIDAAIRWLRFWGEKGFGFHAWY
jgi:hypothetical protein